MISFIRRHKKFFFFLLDLFLIILIAWLSFLLRFEGNIPENQYHNLRNLIILALIFNLPIFYWQKLYHFTWAYVGISELYRFIKAMTISTVLIAATLFVFRDSQILVGFPRSIIFINYFLTILIIGGLRIAKRIFVESIKPIKKLGRKVLIIGANDIGVELARSIFKTKEYNLVGFIDDTKEKIGTYLYGYPILGERKEILEIVKKFDVQEIIIAIPSIDSETIKETVNLCRQAKIEKIKILPSFNEILNGKISLTNIREISIEDLLGRQPVKMDTDLIKNFIANKKILITGAAGSIGSNLCHEVLKFNPAQLIAFDQNETGIFYLENDLERKYPNQKNFFEVGDIHDEKKINWLFSQYQPEIVFHAAAYKHVPLMEISPDEAVKNNIFGTLIVAQAAINSGVKNFVFISTDKAINPTSVMGATKRIGEMICLWLNKKNQTRFCAVRFGNVLDSQGNVIGLFEKQIKSGGPVEVTHPEMKRYFMTATEACLLVMEAAALSQGGEVFVLDMGKPIKILDLAKEMIKLAGYQPDIDIPIVFTKPRPGEKLFEEILTDKEMPTKYEKIYIAKLTDFDEKKLINGLEKLKMALDEKNKKDIIKILKEIVPNYQPNHYE